VLPSAGAATVAALKRLHAATPAAERLVGALRATAPSAASVVPPLAAVVDQLRPFLARLAPYAPDAAHLLYELDDAGIATDASGILGRIEAVVGATSVATLSSSEQAILKRLLGAGVASMLSFKGANNYPAPGSADAPGAASSYSRVQADRGG
jgi:hypothetical protein